jgi:hypothetical protein
MHTYPHISGGLPKTAFIDSVGTSHPQTLVDRLLTTHCVACSQMKMHQSAPPRHMFYSLIVSAQSLMCSQLLHVLAPW